MAVYDIGVFAGHGNGDAGAVGNNLQEATLTAELTQKVVKLLESKGLSVHYGVNNFTNVYTNNNTYNKKLCVSIHFNGATDSSANGAEILVPLGEKDFALETNILQRFVTLGSYNRGLKSREFTSEAWSSRKDGTALSGTDWFREIRNAWSKGISLSIIEVAFITNTADIGNYVAKKDEYALAIANSILKYLKMTEIVESTATPDGTMYRVITGSFSTKANAEKRVAELKSAGFGSFILPYK